MACLKKVCNDFFSQKSQDSCKNYSQRAVTRQFFYKACKTFYMPCKSFYTPCENFSEIANVYSAETSPSDFHSFIIEWMSFAATS